MHRAWLTSTLRAMDTRHRAGPAGPLSHIRVLDLSRLLPGPYCSLLLAQLGADVIKVETPLAGDYARMAPPEAGFGGVFEALNRGKRSLALDYRRPHGRDVILELAQTADVFLESSRPGRLDRCGLGPAAVREANPAIVYCSISGYGQVGPHRDRPGHDIDYLAVSGVLSLLGPPGAQPQPPALQLADVATGTLAAARILAALVGRAGSGYGAYLDISMLDAAVSWLGTLGEGIARAGRAAGPMSGAYPCYSTYRAADDRWLAVGALEPQFWEAFCRGLDREDLSARQFDPQACGEVAAEILTRTSTAWYGAVSPRCMCRTRQAPGRGTAGRACPNPWFRSGPRRPGPRAGGRHGGRAGRGRHRAQGRPGADRCRRPWWPAFAGTCGARGPSRCVAASQEHRGSAADGLGLAHA